MDCGRLSTRFCRVLSSNEFTRRAATRDKSMSLGGPVTMDFWQRSRSCCCCCATSASTRLTCALPTKLELGRTQFFIHSLTCGADSCWRRKKPFPTSPVSGREVRRLMFARRCTLLAQLEMSNSRESALVSESFQSGRTLVLDC